MSWMPLFVLAAQADPCLALEQHIAAAHVLLENHAAPHKAVVQWLERPVPACDRAELNDSQLVYSGLLRQRVSAANPTNPQPTSDKPKPPAATRNAAVTRKAASARKQSSVGTKPLKTPAAVRPQGTWSSDRPASLKPPHDAMLRSLATFRRECVDVPCSADRYHQLGAVLAEYLHYSLEGTAADQNRAREALAALIGAEIAPQVAPGIARAVVAYEGLNRARPTLESLEALPPELRALVQSGAATHEIAAYFARLTATNAATATTQLVQLEAIRDAANARRMLATLAADNVHILLDTSRIVEQAPCSSGTCAVRETARQAASEAFSATAPPGALVHDSAADCPDGRASGCDATFVLSLTGESCDAANERRYAILVRPHIRGAHSSPTSVHLSPGRCNSNLAGEVEIAVAEGIRRTNRELALMYAAGQVVVDSAVVTFSSKLAHSCPPASIANVVGGLDVYVHHRGGAEVQDAIVKRLSGHASFRRAQRGTRRNAGAPGVHVRVAGDPSALSFSLVRPGEDAAAEPLGTMHIAGAAPMVESTQPIALEAAYCLSRMLLPPQPTHEGDTSPRQAASRWWSLAWAGLPYLLDERSANDSKGHTLAVLDAVTTVGALALLTASVNARRDYATGASDSLATTRRFQAGAALLGGLTIGVRLYGFFDY